MTQSSIEPGHIVTEGSVVSPIVLASPHSGRDYPAAFLAQTRLASHQLRRAEDAYVDDLLAPAVALGLPLIAARYGRSFIDLNREEGELDPAMYADSFPVDAAQGTERVRAGLGVVPRIASAGLDIYASRLRLADARARIAAVHRPYHAVISTWLARARAANGLALLLDCHSMPTPPPDAFGQSPHFVLGDLDGQSADPVIVDTVERELRASGWRVARNDPYAGGHTTSRHADPGAGIHVLQIEIDRALYMNPARLERHAGFAAVAASLARVAEALLVRLPGLTMPGPLRHAAE